MITEFVKKWDENKGILEDSFAAKHPESYEDIVRAVISILGKDEDGGCPDPDRIHEIDDGVHSGMLVYVIAENKYQPYDYWYVRVSYGSCSACDTLEAIRRYSDEKPTPEQVKDYMTLALHVVQSLKKMGDDFVG